MIDEKLLIEVLKQRISSHDKDADDFKEYEVKFDMEEMHLRLADECQAIIELIEEQPKVNEWIPCSKKLPEVEKEVLVFTEGNSQRVWNLLDHDDEYVWEDEFGGWNEFEEVLAWMPLPEAYKE